MMMRKYNIRVTEDGKSKTYDGSAFSAFTATITGFVNGDTAAVVSGSPAFSGAATTATNAGSYTITPALGTLTATNYSFGSFVNDTLTINAVSLTVTAERPRQNYARSQVAAR